MGLYWEPCPGGARLLRLLGEQDALEHVRIMKRVAELSEQIAEQNIS